eukprot:s140_g44.t1
MAEDSPNTVLISCGKEFDAGIAAFDDYSAYHKVKTGRAVAATYGLSQRTTWIANVLRFGDPHHDPILVEAKDRIGMIVYCNKNRHRSVGVSWLLASAYAVVTKDEAKVTHANAAVSWSQMHGTCRGECVECRHESPEVQEAARVCVQTLVDAYLSGTPDEHLVKKVRKEMFEVHPVPTTKVSQRPGSYGAPLVSALPKAEDKQTAKAAPPGRPTATKAAPAVPPRRSERLAATEPKRAPAEPKAPLAPPPPPPRSERERKRSPVVVRSRSPARPGSARDRPAYPMPGYASSRTRSTSTELQADVPELLDAMKSMKAQLEELRREKAEEQRWGYGRHRRRSRSRSESERWEGWKRPWTWTKAPTRWPAHWRFPVVRQGPESWNRRVAVTKIPVELLDEIYDAENTAWRYKDRALRWVGPYFPGSDPTNREQRNLELANNENNIKIVILGDTDPNRQFHTNMMKADLFWTVTTYDYVGGQWTLTGARDCCTEDTFKQHLTSPPEGQYISLSPSPCSPGNDTVVEHHGPPVLEAMYSVECGVKSCTMNKGEKHAFVAGLTIMNEQDKVLTALMSQTPLDSRHMIVLKDCHMPWKTHDGVETLDIQEDWTKTRKKLIQMVSEKPPGLLVAYVSKTVHAEMLSDLWDEMDLHGCGIVVFCPRHEPHKVHDVCISMRGDLSVYLAGPAAEELQEEILSWDQSGVAPKCFEDSKSSAMVELLCKRRDLTPHLMTCNWNPLETLSVDRS